VALRGEGLSFAEIAQRLGCSAMRTPAGSDQRGTAVKMPPWLSLVADLAVAIVLVIIDPTRAVTCLCCKRPTIGTVFCPVSGGKR
jgi:hypothetical protein